MTCNENWGNRDCHLPDSELSDDGRRFEDTSGTGPESIGDSRPQKTTETSTRNSDTSDGTINLLV